jgi:predicted Zn-dependent peptidase
MNAILANFLEKGPTQEELDRVRSTYFANFLKGIERIGGFGGKSDILASNQVYGGSPDYYKTMARYISEATVEDIHKVCREWLSNGKFVLVCEPFPTLKAAETVVNRNALPELGKAVPSSFPDLQRATLKNGLQVVLAQRKGVPTIAGRLIMNAGYASDALSKPGLASLAMDMMDEGSKTRDALQISEQMQLLGASISAGSDMDNSYLNFTTLNYDFLTF